jgi:hypothetical protein
MNEMAVLYDDTQNVTLKTEAEVLAIEIEAGQACAGAQPGAGAHRRNALAYMS